MNINELEGLECLNEQEMQEVDGGIVVTGTMVLLAVGAFAAGVTIGYYVGQWWQNR